MRIIFRNLITTIKRFRTPFLLNIFGLSVAFAAFYVIISQVVFEYGYDKCHPNYQQLFRGTLTMDEGKVAVFSEKLIKLIEQSSPKVEQVAGLWLHTSNISVRDENEEPRVFKEKMALTMPENDNVFDLEVIIGDKDALTKPNSYLIPECLAKKFFGTKDPIGQKINRGTVGGIYRDLPENSVVGHRVYYTPQNKPNDGIFGYVPVIKLTNAEAYNEVVELVNKEIQKIYPPEETKMEFNLTPITDVYYQTDVAYDFEQKGNYSTTRILLVIAILVVVIAMVNYINFASAMMPVRLKSINLQKILGGSLPLLRCSILLESLFMSIVAFILSLIVVMVLNDTPFTSLLMTSIEPSANTTITAYTLFCALVVGVTAGIFPAFYMTSFPPVLAIKGTFVFSPVGRRLRSVLVGLQFIISIVLIVSTVFINRQNSYIGNFNQGFEKEEVVFAEFSASTFDGKMEALQNAMRACGYVNDVTFAAHRFGITENYVRYAATFNDNKQYSFYLMAVAPNFFDVLGIQISEGRNFEPTDLARDNDVMIFNQCAKNNFGIDLNDKLLISEEANISGEVIGFAAEGLHTLSLHQADFPFAFMVGKDTPLESMWTMFIRINSGADKIQAVQEIKKKILEVNPLANLSLSYLNTMTETLYQKDRKTASLIMAFSVLAILVSLMGVFGLVMFETQYRRKEIGLRRVHGATVNEILLMFNNKFVKIVLVCFVISIPISYYFINKWLSTFTYRTPMHWWIFALALLLILVITAATVTIRSLKAATNNPAESIKVE